MSVTSGLAGNFPSFSEGLSLRRFCRQADSPIHRHFPSFSEGLSLRHDIPVREFLTGGYFPSFSEGLSLRLTIHLAINLLAGISLPFRRDFH